MHAAKQSPPDTSIVGDFLLAPVSPCQVSGRDGKLQFICLSKVLRLPPADGWLVGWILACC